MIEIRINPSKIKKYLKENLGAPFIIGFQILLLWCAFLMSRGYSSMANETAIYAYYMLVVGVILQLVSFLMEEKAKQKNN